MIAGTILLGLAVAAAWTLSGVGVAFLLFAHSPIEDEMNPFPLLAIADTLEARADATDLLLPSEMRALAVEIRNAATALPPTRTAAVLPLHRGGRVPGGAA